MLVLRKTDGGFTLVEILICLLLGALLLAMIIGLYVSNVGTTNKSLVHSRLRTDLQALIGIIENDLRRAGYGGEAFMVGENSNKVFESINTIDQQCIIYAYNFDQVSTATIDHFMGFRYSKNTQSIQFGRKVDKQVNNCFSSGYWVNLTDPNFLKITEFSLIENHAVNAEMTIRSLHIGIQAEWVKDGAYRHQASTQIQTRSPESN